jgi:hypothetical protein
MSIKNLSAIALTATLCAPAVSWALPQRGEGPAPSTTERRQEERRFRDAYRNDEHVWDAREEQLYREYLAEHHMRFREFWRLNARQQRAFWVWRHQRDERGRDRDHDGDRDRR